EISGCRNGWFIRQFFKERIGDSYHARPFPYKPMYFLMLSRISNSKDLGQIMFCLFIVPPIAASSEEELCPCSDINFDLLFKIYPARKSFRDWERFVWQSRIGRTGLYSDRTNRIAILEDYLCHLAIPSDSYYFTARRSSEQSQAWLWLLEKKW